MKRVGIIMDDDLHKQLRIYAVKMDKSVKDIIVELVKKEVETKKSKHSKFGDRCVYSKTGSRKTYIYM